MSDETVQLPADQSARACQIKLDVTAGPHTGRSWTFADAQHIVLGRQAPSHLRLAEEVSISRQHIELRIDPPRVELADLDSSNGTKVNGIRVVNASLCDGDLISIGNTELRLSVLIPSQGLNGCSAMAPSTPESAPSSLIDGDDKSPALTLVSPPCSSPDASASPPVPKGPTDAIEQTRVNPDGRSRREDSHKTPSPVSSNPHPDAGGSVPGDTFSKTRRSEFIADESAVAITTAGSFPDRIGVYDMKELLGRGGMATVHLAEHRRTGAQVAIKLIRTDLATTDKHVRLFVREAGLITRMNHPRIVKAFEFGIDGSMPYLVMEYLETIDLLSLLDRKPPEDRIKIATWVTSRILQAVHYAHDQGIVHRDIKPGNVLAYREGRHLQIKIADFGLAKTFEDAGLSALTNERSLRGTIAYMAPEQFKNSRDAPPEVDLFACGACLYRMLSGTIPNMITKADETLHRLDQCDDLPVDLRELVKKSIHCNPHVRFPSTAAFAEALFPYHRRV
ncbi:FHA domain-containing serine/threonine-protein kinase [Rhodopirellula sallentina]|uniref:Serine/threonine protein kinase n=1 Tax=Rhodopirellula sallentina SM41 TaxID=1263870 RepID=M5UE15_9BACT|nr:FHA domain-containing serine/threonine-protein kinase [Rhodopirellula sallentina]EMI54223.1 serine/threonine protein kinase [Rhodopirellula sallentina SM41]